MKRKKDWRADLMRYVERTACLPFAPGTQDCAVWTAGAVRAMTGTDMAAPYRGNYETLAEGYLLLRRSGYEDAIEIAAENLPSIPPLQAQVGDVAVVMPEGSNEPALGIVQGPFVYVLREDGLGHVPLSDAIRAFRV